MSSVKFFFQLLSLKQKTIFAAIIVMTFIATFLEMISIFLIIPLISKFLNNEIIFNGYLSIFFEFLYFLDFSKLVILFIIIFSLKFFLLLFVSYYLNHYIFSIYENLVNRYYISYLDKDLIFHKKKNIAEITRNLNDNIKQISIGYTNSLASLILDSIILTGLAITLILTQPLISIGLLGFIAFLALIISNFFKKISYKFSKERQKEQYNFLKAITETFNGIKEIKIFLSEMKVMKIFFEITKKLSRFSLYINFYNQSPRYILEYILILTVIIYVWFLKFLDNSNIEIVSNITVLSFILVRSIPIINKIVISSIGLKVNKPALDALQKDFSSLKHKADFNFKNNIEKKISFKKDIRFKNIYFRYSSKDQFILKNINLKINRGQIVGILGESGSGKTTLIELLMGLLLSTKGKILIDNKIYLTKKNVRSWYENISYVPQNVFLIDDTIKKNITFTDENETLKNTNNKKFIDAISNSQLKKFIYTKKERINLNIGQMGSLLSGGERQRIGIARALYKNSDLLIFDESTNALDTVNEKKIIKMINKFKKEKTIILISHKKSSLDICDIIYSINNGRLNKLK